MSASSTPGTLPVPLLARAGIGRVGLLALLGALAAMFALRLALMVGSGASLHIDEAQYWAWSRELAWGYFSKPPAVAVLIRGSTALWGDTELGVRALAMLVWLLAGLALLPLARAMVPADPRAGAWAAAIFLCAPLASLLGMVATTDALLVLCWAVALGLLWQAVQRRSAWAWLGFAVVCGIGLLDKYTMLALLPGALGWAWWAGRSHRQPHVLPALAACALALLMLGPNLAWNAAQGWPTLQHTAEITVHAGRGGLDVGGFLLFLAGQGVAAGPLIVPLAAWRLVRSRGSWPLPGWGVFLLWTHAPLLLAGLLQAAAGHAELNWIAPVHLAAALALACTRRAWLASARLGVGLLTAQLGLVLLLTVLPALWHAAAPQSPWAARLDLWARMRGWDDALAALGAALPPRDRQQGMGQGAARELVQEQVPPLVVTTSRAVHVHAAWHWRDRAWVYAAWQAGPVPAHHFELHCPWQPGRLQHAGTVVVLSEGPMPAALAASVAAAGGESRPLASAVVRRWGQPRQMLVLTELRAGAAAVALPTAGAPGRVCR